MKLSLLNILFIFAIFGLSISLYVERHNKLVTISTAHDSFSWNVRQRSLAASPVWNKTDSNPPLAVRDAIKISHEIRKTISAKTKPLKMRDWTFESISLVQLDQNRYTEFRSKWCYVANFQGFHKNDVSGPPHRMSMLILMDGTIVPGDSGFDPSIHDAIITAYTE